MSETITRSKGGTAEREEDIRLIVVPDLWHIAMSLNDDKKPIASEMVLECWHLCHDLLKHIRGE